MKRYAKQNEDRSSNGNESDNASTSRTRTKRGQERQVDKVIWYEEEITTRNSPEEGRLPIGDKVVRKRIAARADPPQV